jgi:hypothetical protein
MQGSAIDATRANYSYEDTDALSAWRSVSPAIRSPALPNNYAGLPHSRSDGRYSHIKLVVRFV